MAEFLDALTKTGPTGASPANEIDTYIREDVTKAVLERLELEHFPLNDDAYATPAELAVARETTSPTAQGRHKAGVVGCMFVGTTAEIGALSGMGKGALVFNTETGYFRYYNGSTWTNVPVVANPLTAGTGIQLVGENNAVSIGAEVPISGVGYSVPWALTDAASIVIDASKSNVFTITLGGNRTFATPSNLKTGCSYIFIITQDGTGSRTLNYDAVFTFADATIPILSTTANVVDMLSCIYDGTKLRCVMLNNFGR